MLGCLYRHKPNAFFAFLLKNDYFFLITGSWGKRDPAWTNLKGIWGKRSLPDRITE